MSGPDELDRTQPDSILERARAAHVVVIGGGIAGLVAALRCADVGMRVTLLEATDRLGGAIRAADVAGLRLDVGAESFALRGGSVRELIDELGLGADVVSPAPGGAWVAGLPGAAPLPVGGILGIPANPWAPDVRRIIGWRGTWRAYLDRLRPPLTIGHQHSLGALVRSRMGARVLDRLVAPVVTGVYSARPDDIDVDVAAPGLNSALTRVGSLAGAVAVVRGDRDPKAPGAAVAGIDGGMRRLVERLVARLEELGATIRIGVPVAELGRHHGEWRVTTVADSARGTDTVIDSDALDSDALDSDGVSSRGERILRPDAVIVATGESDARRLLADVLPAFATATTGTATATTVTETAPTQPRVDVVTLVLDSAALDAAPRGTGVLTVPGTSRAKALTHSTAKWPWLAAHVRSQHPTHGHRHVVRVSFGAQGEAPATDGMTDADAFALAVSEAAQLLGVSFEPGSLVGAHLERYTQSQPASAIGQGERMRAARAAVRSVPGLGATGAWLSGTGLAQVIPDATAEAEHVRRGLLWGPDALA